MKIKKKDVADILAKPVHGNIGHYLHGFLLYFYLLKFIVI
jgi:hypothetical protein